MHTSNVLRSELNLGLTSILLYIERLLTLNGLVLYRIRSEVIVPNGCVNSDVHCSEYSILHVFPSPIDNVHRKDLLLRSVLFELENLEENRICWIHWSAGKIV